MKGFRFYLRGRSTPNTELTEMSKYSVEIGDPQDQNNDYQGIQDRLDLRLHGDKPVHDPKQKSCCDNGNNDGGKWHLVRSNHFPNRVHALRKSRS
jgi:hypothetical protein